MLANFAVSKLQYFHFSYLYSYEQFFDQELLSFFPIKIDMFFYLTFESFEFALRTKKSKGGALYLIFPVIVTVFSAKFILCITLPRSL